MIDLPIARTYRAIQQDILSTEKHLTELKQRSAEILEQELVRLSNVFKEEHGINIRKFMVGAKQKCDFMNYGYLLDYFGDDFLQVTEKLEQLGYLKIHYVFFDQDNPNEETEIEFSEYLECSKPDELGFCIHPILGERCTQIEFQMVHYKYASTTQKYTDFILNNTWAFSETNG